MTRRIGGVLIGVSAQEDERISALLYAARDAEALWAVVADAAVETGGDATDTVLLLDENATQDAVLNGLERAVQDSATPSFDLYTLHLSCHVLPNVGCFAMYRRGTMSAETFQELASPLD